MKKQKQKVKLFRDRQNKANHKKKADRRKVARARVLYLRNLEQKQRRSLYV